MIEPKNFESRVKMTIQRIEKNGVPCTLVESGEVVIRDAQSALDLLMSAKYEAGTKDLVIAKKCICEDFFILSTGLAGEILQKFVNYGARIAIYGDYSRYTSKPLHDFMRESNEGRDVFFASTKDAAIDALCC